MGEFNRSTQHPSLEHTDCWCRSNFSIKGQEIRHRSRSFERLRRYPPVLAALPALSALCLQLQHKPCPCMSLHMHAIPTWRIRVKGCCVDRLSPPWHSGHSARRVYSPGFMSTRPSPQFCPVAERPVRCRAAGAGRCVNDAPGDDLMHYAGLPLIAQFLAGSVECIAQDFGHPVVEIIGLRSNKGQDRRHGTIPPHDTRRCDGAP